MKNTTRQLIQKTRDYLDYIEEHYENVQKAWNELKEKCKDMTFMHDDFRYFCIQDQIDNHDYSKLSCEEFVQYRQKFYSIPGEEINKDLFNSAWEHHKKENAHHWEHWTKLLTMRIPYDQEIACVHMVCDWMAMGYKFGDTAKNYYEENKDKIELPDWAITYIYEIFDRIY